MLAASTRQQAPPGLTSTANQAFINKLDNFDAADAMINKGLMIASPVSGSQSYMASSLVSR
jgi:hypothetical protein